MSATPNDLPAQGLVDHFRSDVRTARIPVVVISSTEKSAAEAQASPNVRETVVMPYDIDALRDAVARALGNPPPDATLPESATPVTPAVGRAAEVLIEGTQEPELPLDASESMMRKASLVQLRDLSRRKKEGQGHRQGWSGSSFIESTF